MSFLVAVSLFLAIYGNAVVLLRPGAYVVTNLVTAGALVAAGRLWGLSWGELGLAPAAFAPGLRWGVLLALGAGAAVAIVAAIPRGRRLFADRRLAGMSARELAFRTLLRIPLGTALVEEVAFRGVLLGAWLREGSAAAAVVGSSVLFGVWHVCATIQLMRANRPDAPWSAVVAAVAVGVVATAAGGAAFALLRIHVGSVVAPAIVHAALNGAGTLAAYLTYPEVGAAGFEPTTSRV